MKTVTCDREDEVVENDRWRHRDASLGSKCLGNVQECRYENSRLILMLRVEQEVWTWQREDDILAQVL